MVGAKFFPSEKVLTDFLRISCDRAVALTQRTGRIPRSRQVQRRF